MSGSSLGGGRPDMSEDMNEPRAQPSIELARAGFSLGGGDGEHTLLSPAHLLITSTGFVISPLSLSLSPSPLLFILT